jgi:tetratricopeptide (TPR) repeat protein
VKLLTGSTSRELKVRKKLAHLRDCIVLFSPHVAIPQKPHKKSKTVKFLYTHRMLPESAPMQYLDLLKDPEAKLHQIFKQYNDEYRKFLDSAEEIASRGSNHSITAGIAQERKQLSLRPFADPTLASPSAHLRDQLLSQSDKSDSDLLRLATLSVLFADFYTASLCYSDLFAHSVDLSIGQRYLASIVLTHFKSWSTIISLIAPVADQLALPHRLDAYFRIGLSHKHLRQYDQAIIAFRHCQDHPPPLLSKSDLAVEVSHTYLLQGNLSAGLAQFDHGAIWTPALIQQQAFLCMISDDPAKIELGGQLLSNYRGTKASANLLYLHGRLLYKRELPREAWEALSNAIQLDPERPLFWCALGNVYVRIGQLREAIDCYVRAITLDSDMIEAWLNYAAVLELSPELREQMQDFEAHFPDRPVTGAVRTGRDRLPTIIEPNDRARFPTAADLVEQVFMGEVPELRDEIVEDDALLTEARQMELAAEESPLEEEEESERLDEYDSSEETSIEEVQLQTQSQSQS